MKVVLPDPSDPSQTVGSSRVGRFGWKAGVPNLVQFSADAYVNEMGITTQHCFQGTSVVAFATESAPNGVPVQSGCDDNLPGTDDAVGTCAPGQTEVQDDVAEFNTFMTFLSPPPRAANAPAVDVATNSTTTSRTSGPGLFDSTGCADCHTRQTFTTPRNPTNGVPGNFAFKPFSDFLVHDMGSLGDQIGNAGDSQATTRRMRTAPLWGIRFPHEAPPRRKSHGRAYRNQSARRTGCHGGEQLPRTQLAGQEHPRQLRPVAVRLPLPSARAALWPHAG